MEFTDRILICSECGGEFIFTAGEQLFFFDKQFRNDPKRCKPCKSKRVNAAQQPGSSVAPLPTNRTETRTHCSQCGIETTVPFRPTQGRPVLCRQCFQARTVPKAPEQASAAPAAGDLGSLPSEPPGYDLGNQLSPAGLA